MNNNEARIQELSMLLSGLCKCESCSSTRLFIQNRIITLEKESGIRTVNVVKLKTK